MMKRSRGYRVARAIVAGVLCLLLLTAGLVVHAYFSALPRVYTENGSEIFRIGMNLSLLFGKVDPAAVADGTSLGILQSSVKDEETGEETKSYYTFDNTASWGSKQNPYLICELRHLQNLSVLQNAGYFDELYISQNYDEEGNYTGDGTAEQPGDPIMPYFLICAPDGTPVTIDGEGVRFEPVGNENYPFIGYVGGAFTQGSTTQVGAFDSDTSALYRLCVEADEDLTDVGLFGSVSYLGTEPPFTEDEDGDIIYAESFNGAISSVCNVLLADVSVRAVRDSFIENLAEHLFTYSRLEDAQQNRVPHEDHHVGILVGHVEYAAVEFISVHYSEAAEYALDLRHADANYYSCTGILGFVYQMNPVINTDGTVGTATGTSGEDILLSLGGLGTGGGLLSGTGRGYVTAAEMYTDYSYTAANKRAGLTVWSYTYEDNEELFANEGIMIQKHADGSYTLEDGETTVSVAEQDGVMTVTVGENTWTTFIVHDTTVAEGGDYQYYAYKNGTATRTKLKVFSRKDLLIAEGLNAAGEKLCTEWIRKRILGGTEATGRYYFYDGVFTFCLSDANDVLRDTWENNTVPTVQLGEDNANAWEANTTEGFKAVVAYIKPITSQSALNTAITQNKNIFVMAKPSAGKSFLMNLNTASTVDTGNGEDSCYTNGISQDFADQELIDKLVAGYDSGDVLLPSDIGADYNTKEKLTAALNSGALEVLNVGTSDSSVSVAALKEQYNIRIANNGSTYTLQGSNGKNYMRLLHRNYNAYITELDYYSIWCGPDSYKGSDFKFTLIFSITPTVHDSKNATINFAGNGSCTISYTYNGQTRYVNYNASNSMFNGATGTGTNTTLYLYTVEGTQDINHGRITFDPAEGTDSTSFKADEAILWPNTTYAGGVSNTSTTYTLKTLEQLYAESQGWRNHAGEPLTASDLHKKFQMTQSPGFGAMVNLGSGSLDIGGSRQVIAPVGSNGVEANIPMGCVAFRINTDRVSMIRVIVAVPTIENYEGEDFTGDFFTTDYRFGVWQVEEAGGSVIQDFNPDDALEQFELPRSNRYNPATNAGSTTSNYINVTSGSKNYRCYLNGNCVLVGYEFEVQGEGVYVLGTTSGPMEIVYFSADGTASEGRDGISGSKIGSIDFVYDHGGNIITVKETVGTESEDYQYYYASLCLVYTDITQIADNTGEVWQYYKVNDARIRVRRSIGLPDDEATVEKAILSVSVSSTEVEDAAYIKSVRYSFMGDVLVREDRARE